MQNSSECSLEKFLLSLFDLNFYTEPIEKYSARYNAMFSVLLILPDFFVILVGFLLMKFFHDGVFNETFWKGAEKIVFYVLFPPLLFTSVASSNLTLDQTGYYLFVALSAMMCAVVMSYLIRFIVKADPVTHASAFHCGFRFNTYVGFALVSRLFGQEGLALMSLLIAFWVPISNSIAVAALASAVAKREQASGKNNVLSKTFKAIVTNPLIIATSLGLIVNLTSISVPTVAMTFFKSLGNASLAMGLLCIGAGLKLSGMKSEWKLVAFNTIERLVATPTVALLFCLIFDLPPTASGALMIFAMLPTAQSCYVMTASMRGNAPLVAGITTAHTLAAIITIPCWIVIITSLL